MQGYAGFEAKENRVVGLTATGPRTPGIISMLEEAEKSVAQAFADLEMLKDRLSPILFEMNPERGAQIRGAAPSTPASQVENGLLVLNDRLRQLFVELQMLKDSVRL